jgi:hypothetical protein
MVTAVIQLDETEDHGSACIEIIGYAKPFVLTSMTVSVYPLNSQATHFMVESCKEAYDCFAEHETMPVIDIDGLSAADFWLRETQTGVTRLGLSVDSTDTELCVSAKHEFLDRVIEEFRNADTIRHCIPMLK